MGFAKLCPLWTTFQVHYKLPLRSWGLSLNKLGTHHEFSHVWDMFIFWPKPLRDRLSRENTYRKPWVFRNEHMAGSGMLFFPQANPMTYGSESKPFKIINAEKRDVLLSMISTPLTYHPVIKHCSLTSNIYR